MAPPVMLTAWIDFLDPWSWVVVTRLARLSEDFGERVELEWRSFVSYPSKQTRDLGEWRRSTGGWMEPAAAEPGLRFSMWSTDNPPPTHSVPALAAALVAYDEDPVRAPDYCEALFRAHFTQNRTISDGRTLIDVAREAGFDEDGFAMRLRGRYAAYAKLAIDQHNEGARRQVTHAPAVMVGGEYLVRGPAEEKQYRDLIEQLLGVGTSTVAGEPDAGTSKADAGPAAPDGGPAEPEAKQAPDPEPEAEAKQAPEPADDAVAASPAPGSEPAGGPPSPAAASAPVEKAPAKKSPAKKSPAKKSPAKKAPAKKRRPAKKRVAKKAAAGIAGTSSTPDSGSPATEQAEGSGPLAPDPSP